MEKFIADKNNDFDMILFPEMFATGYNFESI